eukprot:CAMPEP_0119095106 /NCGR_PEP_ID=MMETSP1178-20130426/168461_1 /TAXON_ID=33656 /ORGANISM="unid sp, Strain CCMP2000" /LENGTH=54 /DNA_ID=CAMNT_0007078893 /DNA_START=42 /DNA_END=202 /DNA_ORIENTATION=+
MHLKAPLALDHCYLHLVVTGRRAQPRTVPRREGPPAVQRAAHQPRHHPPAQASV